jgi:hypothetical protein
MASDPAGPLTLDEIDEALADYSARLLAARAAGDATDARLIERVIASLLDQRPSAELELLYETS